MREHERKLEKEIEGELEKKIEGELEREFERELAGACTRLAIFKIVSPRVPDREIMRTKIIVPFFRIC